MNEGDVKFDIEEKILRWSKRKKERKKTKDQRECMYEAENEREKKGKEKSFLKKELEETR